MLGDTLFDLFGSRVRVRVLARLLGEPGRRFGVREMARAVRLNAAGVGRELRRLHGLGIVRDARRGTGILYRINSRHPHHDALRRLFRA